MRATVSALGGKPDPLPDYQPTVEEFDAADLVTDESVRAGSAALAQAMGRGAGMLVRRVPAAGSGEASTE